MKYQCIPYSIAVFSYYVYKGKVQSHFLWALSIDFEDPCWLHSISLWLQTSISYSCAGEVIQEEMFQENED